MNLNAHVVTDFLTRCLDMGLAGGNKTRKLHLAIQTSSVQVLKAFASYISLDHCHINQAVPVLQFLCDKLQDGLITHQPFPVEFCLESILSLLANLPDQVSRSSRYRSFVWRTLCPTLLEFIGVPVPNCPELHKIAEFLVNTDPIWKSGFGSTLLRMYPLTWCVPSSRECGRISGVAS